MTPDEASSALRRPDTKGPFMRRLTLALLALTLAALLAQPAALSAQTAFAPVAMVNDAPITGYELDQRMRLLALNGAPQNPQLRERALDQLIDDRLKREAARRQGVVADEAAMQDAFARYAEQRGLGADALRAQLDRAGVAPRSLMEALGVDAEWRALVRRRFGARAQASEAEIDQEIALASSGRTQSYRLAEIVVPAGRRGPEAAAAQAREIAAELSRGADFAQTARRVSAAPSAARGGEIGWTPASSLPPSALAALDGLGPGDVSAPIDVPGGVAILRLLDTRSEPAPWAGEPTLALLVVSTPLRERAEAEAALGPVTAGAPGCAEVEARANAAGLRAERPERAALSQLPPPVREAVRDLTEGAASPPVAGSNGHAAFIVCERDSGVSPEARRQLADQLRDRRLVSFAEGYMQELRGEAVIELR